MTYIWLQHTATHCTWVMSQLQRKVEKLHCVAECCSHVCVIRVTYMTVSYVWCHIYDWLQHTATHCNTLHLSHDTAATQSRGITLSCSVLQSYVYHMCHINYCNTLQHIALESRNSCNTEWMRLTHVTQQTATDCKTHPAMSHNKSAATLIHVTATDCNRLQQTATDCKRLQLCHTINQTCYTPLSLSLLPACGNVIYTYIYMYKYIYTPLLQCVGGWYIHVCIRIYIICSSLHTCARL